MQHGPNEGYLLPLSGNRRDGQETVQDEYGKQVAEVGNEESDEHVMLYFSCDIFGKVRRTLMPNFFQ
jgi:hypothetical protein